MEESGSGVIARLDGRPGYVVLTNNHVVAQSKPDQITVSLADGRIYRPTQVWADPESDVAILGIDDGPKIAIIFIGTVFQMVRVVANTTRLVDPALLEAAQTLEHKA